jgi:hypothetical protein
MATGVRHMSHVSWLPGRDGRYQVLDNPGSHVGSAPQLWHAPDAGELGLVVADFPGGGVQGASLAASQAGPLVEAVLSGSAAHSTTGLDCRAGPIAGVRWRP